MVNMYKGLTIPCKAVEGTITITDTVSVTGDSKKPVLSNPIAQGDAVAITGDLQVEKATGSNGTIIGFVHDHPEYDVDPVTNYTKAQAISAGMLRNVGVDTAFVDVREVPCKASEGIAPGDYVKYGADGQAFEKSATETNMIALTTQGTSNIVTIGIQ